ncbi:MAG: chromosomal replication initiation protein DnaA [Nitrospinae bacterium RIFCSPLOWO2_12_FULL_47_7]|nr:MAG: chromosomal replication initiation protein DnaA [Nitrospinae bacterium RIFCSPLOWO2_12_FULL_47_7]
MEALWKKCLEEIEKQVLPENYITWFSPTYAFSKNKGTITIAVPNDFFKNCLKENYQDLIENTLEAIAKDKLQVEFQVALPENSEKNRVKPNTNGSKKELSSSTITTGLNPKYNFSSFIVGSCNQFAHATGLAVGANPAHTYNPLFVYGAVGLGKTHLLHAIGNEIIQTNPQNRVRYISAESFTVDLIQSLKKDDMIAFRGRYRPLDVLLVDDIQFLAGKERTQEEFFYTFNSLYESHKQVVLSCDRSPKELHNIEERLRSRFGSGLIADIKPPDLETKMAILYKKAEIHQKEIPQDVAMFIASNIRSNVRELEGLLLRIIAYSSFTRRNIDMLLAKEVLKEFTFDKNKNFTIPTILKYVAEHFDLKVADLKSQQRTRDISTSRQIAMYLCREYTSASLPEIGRQFGGKDHTTVLSAHKKILSKVKDDEKLAKHIQEVIRKIECE